MQRWAGMFHRLSSSLLKKIIFEFTGLCVPFDCGLAVNPDGVKAQMESSIILGLTAALYGEVTLEAGKVKQSNLHNYRMLRIKETPAIEFLTIFLNNTEAVYSCYVQFVLILLFNLLKHVCRMQIVWIYFERSLVTF